MQFSSHHIKGKGRGKDIGFPTINLEIPKEFALEDGVYAVIVSIGGVSYKGAMHFGPIPVFNEIEKSLEVFLIDVPASEFPEIADIDIIISVKKYIREIRSFPDASALSVQIAKDVEDIKNILSL